MSDFDLNIDNYSLEDLLGLFRLKYDFNQQDLKTAKMLALKTHPDKSGLDKEVFLFFLKAYKMCETIYYFRIKRKNLENNDTYTYENLEQTINEKEKEKLSSLPLSQINFKPKNQIDMVNSSPINFLNP